MAKCAFTHHSGLCSRLIKCEAKPFDQLFMKYLQISCAILLVASLAFGVRAQAVTTSSFGLGKNPWLGRTLTKAELLPQIQRAAGYLARQQLADGQFVYLNDPRGKARQDKGDKYSLIRHLGAVYALLRAHEQSPTPAYLEAARKGLEFAKGFVVTKGGESLLRGLTGRPNIGENGFLVLDLALYAKLKGPGFEKDLELGKKLANFVADNLVYGNKLQTKEQWAECQAAMGLILFQEVFGAPKERSESYVSVAEKWLIGAHKDGKRSHWSIQAIAWLGKARPNADKILLEDGLLAGHQQMEGVYDVASSEGQNRLVGSKKGKLNSCNATARNEGLIAAHVLARRLFRPEEASYFLARVKEHLAFAMQFQYGAYGNFYEKDPVLSRMGRLFNLDGGVFDNPTNGSVRIDYVSHHLRAMAAYLSATGEASTVSR